VSRSIVGRLSSVVVVMFVVATIVFVIVRLVPGDPGAVMLGPDARPADVAALREKLGLDVPILQQYVTFLADAATGDLGQSIFLGRPVLQAIGERAEPTICLTLMAIVIAILIGVPAGVISAIRRGGLIDQMVLTLAMLAASLPTFWLALMLIRRFAVDLHWFPVSGYGPPGAPFFTRMKFLVLPSIVLGLSSSSLVTRFTRASMLDVLNEDFVRTARAKGLAEYLVLLKHAFANAAIPVLTVIGLAMALLLGGAVVTETVFALPGVGNLVVSAVLRRDYPVIQGTLLVVAGVYVLVNLAVDLVYVLADPRLRR
jgi:peptide/nickel transport system permease protein